MVTRKRLRRILNALALYASAALLIGYFGINAYNGDRGLKAREDIERQMATLSTELARLILLTYFVDAGLLRVFRNRGKRFGNFVLNEVRNRLP